MSETSAVTSTDEITGGKADRWAAKATTELEKVAATYRGYITYSKLMKLVLGDTETKMVTSSWSNMVLERVIGICEERGLPALTSLVVRENTGMVGSGFDAVLLRSGREAASSQLEREMAAAVERLACYRVYCPNVPVDAEPQLTREYDEYRADIVRKNKPGRPGRTECPGGCGLLLPVTGICDDCDQC